MSPIISAENHAGLFHSVSCGKVATAVGGLYPGLPSLWGHQLIETSGQANPYLVQAPPLIFTAGTLFGTSQDWSVGSRAEFLMGMWKVRTQVYKRSGSKWLEFFSPNVPGLPGYEMYWNGEQEINVLQAVAGDRKKAFAVGYFNTVLDDSTRPQKRLIIEWDGSSWSVTLRPPLGVENERFNGVAMFGTRAWAVGSYAVAASALPLIEQWDGSQWVIATANAPGVSASLNGTWFVDQQNGWAVGRYYETLGIGSTPSPLILANIGSGWFPANMPAQETGMLYGVWGANKNDAWAVGHRPWKGKSEPLIYHWDGSKWTRSIVPKFTTSTYLHSVSGFGTNDVWAVGYESDNSQKPQRTVALRWDGASWSRFHSD